jgi:hypothetical protein
MRGATAYADPSTGGSAVANFEIGTRVRYRGRLHIVVGFTPMGVKPRLLELEDVQSGRTRQVKPSDPDLDVEPIERAEMRDVDEPPDKDSLL